jgi:hypothetical protein
VWATTGLLVAPTHVARTHRDYCSASGAIPLDYRAIHLQNRPKKGTCRAYGAGLGHILTSKLCVRATTGLLVAPTHVARTHWDYCSASGAIPLDYRAICMQNRPKKGTCRTYEAGLGHILTSKLCVRATTGLLVAPTHVARTPWDHCSANGAVQLPHSQICYEEGA